MLKYHYFYPPTWLEKPRSTSLLCQKEFGATEGNEQLLPHSFPTKETKKGTSNAKKNFEQPVEINQATSNPHPMKETKNLTNLKKNFEQPLGWPTFEDKQESHRSKKEWNQCLN